MNSIRIVMNVQWEDEPKTTSHDYRSIATNCQIWRIYTMKDSRLHALYDEKRQIGPTRLWCANKQNQQIPIWKMRIRIQSLDLIAVIVGTDTMIHKTWFCCKLHARTTKMHVWDAKANRFQIDMLFWCKNQ